MSTKATSGYSIAGRDDALDFMAGYEGYGEQRWYSDALGTEQVSFSWRRMPPATGGRGSYGHRHPGQEEVYFVISGRLQFKLEDEVVDVDAGTAIRVAPGVVRSVWNDEPQDAELAICSIKVADTRQDAELVEGFWPE